MEELFDEVPQLDESMSLTSDLLSSLDLVEVMMVLEPQLGFTIQDLDLGSMRTIGDLLGAIELRLTQ